ncbi:hypothetical protein GF325_05925 [Candidatus Bathyarchaeota archaeon]|nr:hypothetical protein [Candidatus Bathyarchaeota archaeon]
MAVTNDAAGSTSSGNTLQRGKLVASMDKFDYLWALGVALGAGLLLTLTGVWQLAALAGFLSGMLVRRKGGIAWWTGFLGVLGSWLIIIMYFIATQPAIALMNLIIEYLIGSSGLWIIGLLLTVMIGALLGGTGSYLGYALILLVKKRPPST